MEHVASAVVGPFRGIGLGRSSTSHIVSCPYCRTAFDLFSASWCEHLDAEQEPSKLCPSCHRCLCEHPAYLEPHFWKEAPGAFQAQGFRQLFLFYL